jgi:hypothetical protein
VSLALLAFASIQAVFKQEKCPFVK